ncbi:hypothetical protein T492DRAFT_833218 [Pavlovales sp. CCMP2436]|nr:hypothetical protein T492DRAFT_833218 [Pavlovales sp. CCMP2436]
MPSLVFLEPKRLSLRQLKVPAYRLFGRYPARRISRRQARDRCCAGGGAGDGKRSGDYCMTTTAANAAAKAAAKAAERSAAKAAARLREVLLPMVEGAHERTAQRDFVDLVLQTPVLAAQAHADALKGSSERLAHLRDGFADGRRARAQALRVGLGRLRAAQSTARGGTVATAGCAPRAPPVQARPKTRAVRQAAARWPPTQQAARNSCFKLMNRLDIFAQNTSSWIAQPALS